MATSTHLRTINRRRIIESLFRLRRASRVELARDTGVSQPTVGRIVDQLISEQILIEDQSANLVVDQTHPTNSQKKILTIGRPSTPLELDHQRIRFLAIHVGVRHTRLALLPLAIPNSDDWAVTFTTPTSASAWAKALKAAWDKHGVKNIQAAIISLPGVVDDEKGKVFLSANLRWIESLDIQELIQSVISVPVKFVQEIRGLALGQLTSSTDVNDFLLVDFGNGVGGAAVAARRIYNGPLPLNCELGHTPVLGNTRVCGCGATGCVETLVSRNGLLASSVANKGPSDWQELMNHLHKHGLPAWLKQTFDAAAVSIASALNVLGLSHVVLTGYLEEMPREAADYLASAIRADTMWHRFGKTICTTAPRRRTAGMISVALDRFLLADK